MNNLKHRKALYFSDVIKELKRRGFSDEDIPVVIGKTGFIEALELYPEEQMHYHAEDAVDEIICTAAIH